LRERGAPRGRRSRSRSVRNTAGRVIRKREQSEEAGGPLREENREQRSRSPKRARAPRVVKEASPGRSASPAAAGKENVRAGIPPKVKVKLYKMGEFACNIVANYVRGNTEPEAMMQKLQIDQRTKVDHCKSHTERAGGLATMWHFSAADRRDCVAYDALCDYFVEKQRVGLGQTPNYYVYIVPPTDKYLKALELPSSNFMVGLQIPIRK